MPVKTNAEGGGGVGSDECTLLRANLPIGFKAVTADSNDEAVDGTFNPDTTAADSHVLEGQSYIKFNPVTKLFERRLGARKNNGSLSASLNCGESFNIPVGDTLGGKVTANSLASQTPGTATAADIILGKKATVNGIILTGTKPNNGTINATLNCGQSKTLPAGSIDGGTITAASLASQTPGNLAANKMLAGTYGFSNGVRVDGNIPSKGAATITPGTANQSIAANQFLTGAQTILGDPNLVESNIRDGVILFGKKGNFQGPSVSDFIILDSFTSTNNTDGVTITQKNQCDGRVTYNPSINMYIALNQINTPGYCHYRINSSFNLSIYKYIRVDFTMADTVNKIKGKSITLGVSSNSNTTSMAASTTLVDTGTLILDISAFSGNYFLYFLIPFTNSTTTSEVFVGSIKKIVLSSS